MTATERLPVLPLRELVLFPGATATLRVGRQASLEALAAASVSETHRLALVSQVDRRVDDPVAADVFTIGVQARIAGVVDADSAEGAREVELVVERRLRLAEIDRDPAGYFAMVERLEQDASLDARARRPAFDHQQAQRGESSGEPTLCNGGVGLGESF